MKKRQRNKHKESVVFAHAQAAKGGTTPPGEPESLRLAEEDLTELLGEDQERLRNHHQDKEN